MSPIKTGSQPSGVDVDAIDAFFTDTDHAGGANSPPALPSPSVATPACDQRVAVQPRPRSKGVISRSDDAAPMDWRTTILRAFSGVCLVGAVCMFVWGYFAENPPTQTAYKTVSLPASQPRANVCMIEDCEVGMRASGRNPLRDQVETLPDPDPETSRKLNLRMTKPSGHRLDIDLIRSLTWIETVGAKEGESFYLDLEEMGAVGDAYVEAIEPCPPIKAGKGNVITGVFAHAADSDTRILSVTFSNGAYLKGVTDNHPFWSVDRNDFVAIGEMNEGDWVKTAKGLTQITKLDPRFARSGEMLYNLETHNEHVFQVSLVGVLVHNSCIDNAVDMQRQLAREGTNGTIWKVQLSAASRKSYPAQLTGKLPGFQGGAPYHAMVVVDRKGVKMLFDNNFKKGISLDDWMKTYARENKISISAAYRELEWKVPNVVREAEFPDRLGPYSQLNPLGD